MSRDFSTWIKGQIDAYGFVEHRDYEIFDSPELGNQSGRGGDRRSKTFMLSLDMAKELAMVSRTAKGLRQGLSWSGHSDVVVAVTLIAPSRRPPQ